MNPKMKPTSRVSTQRSPIGDIRHDLSAALASIEGAFEVLSSGNAKNPERAIEIHKDGVKVVWKLLMRMDELEKEPAGSPAIEGAVR